MSPSKRGVVTHTTARGVVCVFNLLKPYRSRPKLRPIRMEYSGRKLVSGVSLTLAAKEVILKFAQLSSLISDGTKTVVHLIRRLPELYDKTHILFQFNYIRKHNNSTGSIYHGILGIISIL